MAQLMLVNPRARKRKRKAAANPRRRRRVAARPRKRRARRNPIAANPRRRRRARRNPRLSMSGIKGQIMPAAIGAGGALLLNIGMGVLPVPANLKTGLVGSGVKIGVGILGGKILGKALGRSTANQMVAGFLTVVIYDAIKTMLQGAMPNIPMGEYLSGVGYMNAGQWAGSTDQLNFYDPNNPVVAPYTNALPAPDGGANMGEYLNGYGAYGDPSLSYASGY